MNDDLEDIRTRLMSISEELADLGMAALHAAGAEAAEAVSRKVFVGPMEANGCVP